MKNTTLLASATALVLLSSLGCTTSTEFRARRSESETRPLRERQDVAQDAALLDRLKRMYAAAPPPVLPIVKVKLRRANGRTVVDVSFYKDRNGVPGSFVASAAGAPSVIRVRAGGFTEPIELDAVHATLINDAADRSVVTLPGLAAPKISRYSRVFECDSVVYFDHDDAGVYFPDIRGALAYEHD